MGYPKNLFKLTIPLKHHNTSAYNKINSKKLHARPITCTPTEHVIENSAPKPGHVITRKEEEKTYLKTPQPDSS